MKYQKWGSNGEEVLPSGERENFPDHRNGASNLAPLPVSRQRSLGTRFSEQPAPDGYSGLQLPQGNATSDLERLLALLRRRRAIVLGTLGIVLAAGMLWTFLTRPLYQATSTLLITTNADSTQQSISDNVPVLADLMDATKARSQETQIELLKSTPVLQGALARVPASALASAHDYNPDGNAADQLAGHMTAKPVRDSDIIAISVTSHRPRTAAALAEAICAEFIDQSLQQNREQERAATHFVSEQLGTVRAELDQARKRLEIFKTQNNTVDLSAETASAIDQQTQIQSDLRDAQVQMANDLAKVDAYRALAAKLPRTQDTPTYERRPVVEQIENQLTQLQLQRIQALQEYTPNSPDVQTIDKQIAVIKQRLSHEVTTQVGSTTANPNPEYAQVEQEGADAKADLRAQEANARSLSAALVQQEAVVKQLPSKESKLTPLVAELDTLQDTYQLLNQKYLELRVGEEGHLAGARVVSPAEVPSRPVSPKKFINLILFLLIGALLGIGLASLVDVLDDRVHTGEDAEIASRLPVLAYIPFIKEAKEQSLLDPADRNTGLLESYRMLRTNIEFSAVGEPIRSLMVSSSQPNEGKSTTAVDLAVVMALAGKRVIMVDADLRRPSLHRQLDISNKIGFTSVVTGRVSIEEALQDTTVPGLRALTSGPVPPNPTELLQSKGGRNLLLQLVEECDMLIVDTPPALLMADAQIVASIVDAGLLVVSLREAGKREVARTCELLEQSGTKMLGTILNKLTYESGSYYYGYYSYKNRYYGRYFDASKTEDGAALSTENHANGAGSDTGKVISALVDDVES